MAPEAPASGHELALSTRWNAYRHAFGQSMIEDILALGFRRVELGYDLTMDLVPGVLDLVRQGAVSVGSVHNFCPVPVGAYAGHPELFVFTSADRRAREAAIRHTRASAEFAAQVGARHVVVHAGRVEISPLTRKLIALAEEGLLHEPKYEKVKMKLLLKREKHAMVHFDRLCACLDELLPAVATLGVNIALEILPSWEAVPTESEMATLAGRFEGSCLRYWYDTGHGRIRENLGLVSSLRWLERLQDVLAGMHLHDVLPPAFDHLMPPRGKIDFTTLKPLVRPDTALVMEPAPGTPGEEIRTGARVLEQAFDLAKGAT